MDPAPPIRASLADVLRAFLAGYGWRQVSWTTIGNPQAPWWSARYMALTDTGPTSPSLVFRALAEAMTVSPTPPRTVGWQATFD